MPLGCTTIMELFAGDMHGFNAFLLPASVFLLFTFGRIKATAMLMYIKEIFYFIVSYVRKAEILVLQSLDLCMQNYTPFYT